MPEGNDAFMGLAVPLYGQSEIVQRAAGEDIVTLTAITAATADFLVLQTAGGGEVFVIDDEGNIEGALVTLGRTQLDAGAGNYLRFSAMPTTAPTTNLTRGDFFVHAGNTNMGLALCIDSTSNTMRYFTPDTTTFGRDTLS